MKSKILIALLALPMTANADMTSQMDDAFGTLTNVTSPKMYSTSKRHVVSGGQLFITSPTKSVNLASATAPRFSAGCGGIDVYGGSFSFINADEMVQTFKAIGTNAIGYGVKLALESSCTLCANVMTGLEKTAQFMNGLNINSCEAAQGIVTTLKNDGLEGSLTKAKTAVDAGAKGLKDDFNAIWQSENKTGQSTETAVKKANPKEYTEKYEGNMVWKILKKGNVTKSVFGESKEFAELIMSFTGTAVAKKGGDDKDGTPVQEYAGSLIKLTELINGVEKYSKYKCKDKEECLEMESIEAGKFEGFSSRVKKALSNNTDGLITSLVNNSKPSDLAKKISYMNGMYGSICITELKAAVQNRLGNVTYEQMANVCGDLIAMDLANSTVEKYMEQTLRVMSMASVSEALAPVKKRAIEVVEKSRADYKQQYEVLTKSANPNSALAILKTIAARPTANNEASTGDK